MWKQIIILSLLFPFVLTGYVLGHEATHCGVGYLQGATECTITLKIQPTNKLTFDSNGGTLSGWSIAHVNHNANTDLLPQPIEEVIAYIMGVLFILTPIYVHKVIKGLKHYREDKSEQEWH